MRRWHWLAGAGAGIVLAPAIFYALDPFAGPHYNGPPSGHFDGEQFHNLPPRTTTTIISTCPRSSALPPQ
jgi:hypothetical protein